MSYYWGVKGEPLTTKTMIRVVEAVGGASRTPWKNEESKSSLELESRQTPSLWVPVGGTFMLDRAACLIGSGSWSDFFCMREAASAGSKDSGLLLQFLTPRYVLLCRQEAITAWKGALQRIDAEQLGIMQHVAEGGI